MPDEMYKEALKSFLRGMGQRALASGGGASVGGALGAGVGGVAGAVKGYHKANEEERPGLLGAIGGGLLGAAGGGAVGAGLGGAAAGLGGGRAQKLVRGLSSRGDEVGAVSRFGERQVHSLTGALPEGMSRAKGLRAIKASPVEETTKQLLSAAKTKGLQSREVRSLRRAREHAQTLEEMGMTSVPGLFKALATKPGQAMKAGIGREWYGNPSKAGKVWALGAPAGFIAADASSPLREGESRLGKTLGAAGMALPFSLAPMGFAGGTAASMLLGAGGKKIGDKVLPKKKELGQNIEAPVPEDASESGSAERIYSPRVTGDFA